MSEPFQNPASPAVGCEAITAMFVHGPERCRRTAITYVHCEDVFCSRVHPACELHAAETERPGADGKSASRGGAE